jgi:hypothetical protein
MMSSIQFFGVIVLISAIYIYCWQVPNLWHIRIISLQSSITVELHVVARYAKFDNHLFLGLISHISQLLDGCGLSQYITIAWYLVFCHTISPPAETPNNDWLNPYDLGIDVKYPVPPDLNLFYNSSTDSYFSSDTEFLWLIHILSPIVWNLNYVGATWQKKVLSVSSPLF